jgi:hypothetical protein
LKKRSKKLLFVELGAGATRGLNRQKFFGSFFQKRTSFYAGGTTTNFWKRKEGLLF